MFSWQLIIIGIVLLTIIYQDFKFRAISWYWIPVLLVTTCLYSLESIPVSIVIQQTAYNCLFILIQLIAIVAYFSIKQKKLVHNIENYLGFGDILFLVAISPLFSPLNYILFLGISFFIVLIVSVLINKVLKKKQNDIPLAGGIALLLFAMLVVQTMCNVNFMINEHFILNLLVHV